MVFFKSRQLLLKSVLFLILVFGLFLFQKNKDRLALAISMTSAESTRLIRDFKKTQKNELAAFDHRQKTEIKELKQAQAAQRKEWELREKEARHQFFKENSKGPDRRKYIGEFLSRRKSMVEEQKKAMALRIQEQETKRKELIEAQRARWEQFEEAIQRGERPSQSF